LFVSIDQDAASGGDKLLERKAAKGAPDRDVGEGEGLVTLRIYRSENRIRDDTKSGGTLTSSYLYQLTGGLREKKIVKSGQKEKAFPS